ncbi:hypothetical protein VST7929_01965 [Vibrio stylophorae]|uniref:AAA family ATPase n=1 Tax=Vibrio stylophorae TaxID=659351 RepID=A0ABN8DUU7_9VIBR|nr:FimV/HubP family polar landmark protein [Vibrio stylophorae]CAH0534064.1 hypothetical protein VST7929_01965 [Vibrio stylophorae]
MPYCNSTLSQRLRRIFIAALCITPLAISSVSFANTIQLKGPNGETLKQSQVSPAHEAQNKLYGPTSGNETLWSIAKKARPNNSVSVHQTLHAIFLLNPSAFDDDNIHKLKSGQMLRLPTAAYAKQWSTQDALDRMAADKRRLSHAHTAPVATSPAKPAPVRQPKPVTEAAKPAKVEKPKTPVVQTGTLKPEQEFTEQAPTASEFAPKKPQAFQQDLKITDAELEQMQENSKLLRLRLSEMQQEINSLQSQLQDSEQVNTEVKRALAEWQAQQNQPQQSIWQQIMNDPMLLAIFGSVPGILLSIIVALLLTRRSNKSETKANASANAPEMSMAAPAMAAAAGAGAAAVAAEPDSLAMNLDDDSMPELNLDDHDDLALFTEDDLNREDGLIEPPMLDLEDDGELDLLSDGDDELNLLEDNLLDDDVLSDSLDQPNLSPNDDGNALGLQDMERAIDKLSEEADQQDDALAAAWEQSLREQSDAESQPAASSADEDDFDLSITDSKDTGFQGIDQSALDDLLSGMEMDEPEAEALPSQPAAAQQNVETPMLAAAMALLADDDDDFAPAPTADMAMANVASELLDDDTAASQLFDMMEGASEQDLNDSVHERKQVSIGDLVDENGNPSDDFDLTDDSDLLLDELVDQADPLLNSTDAPELIEDSVSLLDELVADEDDGALLSDPSLQLEDDALLNELFDDEEMPSDEPFLALDEEAHDPADPLDNLLAFADDADEIADAPQAEAEIEVNDVMPSLSDHLSFADEHANDVLAHDVESETLSQAQELASTEPAETFAAHDFGFVDDVDQASDLDVLTSEESASEALVPEDSSSSSEMVNEIALLDDDAADFAAVGQADDDQVDVLDALDLNQDVAADSDALTAQPEPLVHELSLADDMADDIAFDDLDGFAEPTTDLAAALTADESRPEAMSEQASDDILDTLSLDANDSDDVLSLFDENDDTDLLFDGEQSADDILAALDQDAQQVDDAAFEALLDNAGPLDLSSPQQHEAHAELDDLLADAGPLDLSTPMEHDMDPLAELTAKSSQTPAVPADGLDQPLAESSAMALSPEARLEQSSQANFAEPPAPEFLSSDVEDADSAFNAPAESESVSDAVAKAHEDHEPRVAGIQEQDLPAENVTTDSIAATDDIATDAVAAADDSDDEVLDLSQFAFDEEDALSDEELAPWEGADDADMDNSIDISGSAQSLANLDQQMAQMAADLNEQSPSMASAEQDNLSQPAADPFAFDFSDATYELSDLPEFSEDDALVAALEEQQELDENHEQMLPPINRVDEQLTEDMLNTAGLDMGALLSDPSSGHEAAAPSTTPSVDSEVVDDMDNSLMRDLAMLDSDDDDDYFSPSAIEDDELDSDALMDWSEAQGEPLNLAPELHFDEDERAAELDAFADAFASHDDGDSSELDAFESFDATGDSELDAFADFNQSDESEIDALVGTDDSSDNELDALLGDSAEAGDDFSAELDALESNMAPQYSEENAAPASTLRDLNTPLEFDQDNGLIEAEDEPQTTASVSSDHLDLADHDASVDELAEPEVESAMVDSSHLALNDHGALVENLETDEAMPSAVDSSHLNLSDVHELTADEAPEEVMISPVDSSHLALDSHQSDIEQLEDTGRDTPQVFQSQPDFDESFDFDELARQDDLAAMTDLSAMADMGVDSLMDDDLSADLARMAAQEQGEPDAVEMMNDLSSLVSDSPNLVDDELAQFAQGLADENDHGFELGLDDSGELDDILAQLGSVDAEEAPEFDHGIAELSREDFDAAPLSADDADLVATIDDLQPTANAQISHELDDLSDLSDFSVDEDNVVLLHSASTDNEVVIGLNPEEQAMEDMLNDLAGDEFSDEIAESSGLGGASLSDDLDSIANDLDGAQHVHSPIDSLFDESGNESVSELDDFLASAGPTESDAGDDPFAEFENAGGDLSSLDSMLEGDEALAWQTASTPEPELEAEDWSQQPNVQDSDIDAFDPDLMDEDSFGGSSELLSNEATPESNLNIDALLHEEHSQAMSSSAQDNASFDDVFHHVNAMGHGDDATAKLDMARAYLDMNDMEAAESLLQEVISDGDLASIQEAKQLMKTLS